MISLCFKVIFNLTLFIDMTGEDIVFVDEIQEMLDQLMLTIFESIRICAENGTSEAALLGGNIANAYSAISSKVDNLIGIHRSVEEQNSLLIQYSTEYSIMKRKALDLEKNLIDLHESVNTKLNEVFILLQLH